MTLAQAKKILKDQGIIWTNYFDLPVVTNNNEVKEAVKKIKLYLLTGIK